LIYFSDFESCLFAAPYTNQYLHFTLMDGPFGVLTTNLSLCPLD